MKIASRIALLDALSVVAVWAAGTAAFGSLALQLADPSAIAVFAAVAALVFWRVRAAYSTGAVLLSRAIAEGVVCGAALATVAQLASWAFLVSEHYASVSGLASMEVAAQLFNEAALGAASGAVLGALLWVGNGLVLRRPVL